MLKIARAKKLYHSSDRPSINPDAMLKRNRAFNDFEYFAREFFPHQMYGGTKDAPLPFDASKSAMHRDFCALEMNPDRRGVKEVTAAPRGNAKTTLKCTIKAIHAIVYGYHKFIIVMGYSGDEADGKTRDIRNELLFNDRLIETYGLLLNPKKAGMSDFTTLNGVRVLAKSRGAQVRGQKHMQHRPSLIILDDVESPEGVNTPEQRQKTRDWFFKDVIGAGSADGKTDFLFIGTVLHAESLLSELLRKPGWKGQKYQAVIKDADRQDLWQAWNRIYVELDNPDAEKDALAFYEANKDAMDAGAEVLWPDGEPYYKLQEYKASSGLASYYSEKQNDPYDPERQIFNLDACIRFRTVTPQDTDWPNQFQNDGFAILMDGKKPIHSSTLRIVAFHDPAMAETNKSDYGAVAVCAQDLDGFVYLIDCWLKKEPPSKQIKAAFDLHRLWNFEILYLETNVFAKLLKTDYHDEGILQGYQLRVNGVDEHKNKQRKISTLEPYFSNGWIRLNEALPPLLIEQFRLFPTVHDDGPDAVQGAVSRLRRPRGTVSAFGGQEGVT